MAISKKGLRSIIIDGEKYYWKFKEKIIVFHSEFTNGILTIDFGFFDIWLYVNDEENRPPDFEPKSITPKFVRESVQFALRKGWKENKMEIVFRDGIYKVKEDFNNIKQQWNKKIYKIELSKT